MHAPFVERKPHTRSIHGEVAEDPLFWLREKSNPEVIRHLDAENEYTELMMAPTAELQEAIFTEIKDRTQETDLAVPSQYGDYWYTTRTEEGASYPIWVRMQGAPAGPQELVLNENIEAEGHDYFRLGNFSISADHRFVAYSTDTTGAESYTTRIRDIETRKDLPDVLEECRYGLAWSRDGKYLFYTMADEALRPFQIWRHRIDTPQTEDVLVLQEDDDRYYLGLRKTRSGEYIVIAADSAVTESAWVISAADPTAEPREVLPRREGVQYSIDHRGDVFWVVINDDGADGRLLTVPAEGGSPREVVAQVAGRKLETPMCFRDHLLVWGREGGLPAVFRYEDAVLHTVVFDEPVYEIAPEGNLEYTANKLRYTYESFVTPRSVFDLDLRTEERVLLKQTPVLGGYDPEEYVQERLWAPAFDGTEIPVSFVRHVDTAVDGTAALLLYAYGAYEISYPIRFSIARLSLLDRGVAFAVAHVRGGGEMGKSWYDGGKLATKVNTFTDFIDVADYLVDGGRCARARIAARGGSAGGLTVGAALNFAPEAFAAVVAEVPFVDVVNTMLDAELPLTVVEWEEWGDPRVEEEYGWLASYAPYENVGAVEYPPILATAGLNDPRVAYWEPTKWVQRLREHSTSETEVLLRTEMSAGHFARSGRYDLWRDEAFVLAFILTRLGASEI